MTSKTGAPTVEKLEIRVKGMKCQGCVEAVEKGLAELEGVQGCEVDLDSGAVQVQMDASKVGVHQIHEAVRKAGYDVAQEGPDGSAASSKTSGLVNLAPGADSTEAPKRSSLETGSEKPATREVELAISGMTCAGCVHTIEQRVSSVPGVDRCEVNLATGTASVNFAPSQVGLDELRRVIEAAGYGARERSAGLEEGAGEDEQQEARQWKRQLIVSAIFTAPLLVLAMSHGALSFTGSHWVQLGLALPVVVYGGGRFFRAAWSAARHGTADMNTLIAVGTGTAFIYSAVATIAPYLVDPSATSPESVPVYFETAAAIITLILLGRMLEARARHRTSGAIRSLLSLQSKTARVVRNGVEQDVPMEDVVAGDQVLVRPGERIPVDGKILEGSSTIDESALTGESIPAEKQAGDEVFSGTLNTSGSFQFEATKVGRDTVLAQIIDLVKKAQSSKAPIARLADVISGYFTPIVIGVAMVTFVAWYLLAPPELALRFAVLNAVAVLIIACPCAMGLATPTAVIVGIGRGAEHGVLIKNGEALEIAHKIRTIVFDKTGTLTTGRPQVTDVIAVEGQNEGELLAAVASIERRSEHPLGEAIVKEARSRNLSLQEPQAFKALAGFGVEADLGGNRWLVGRERLLQDRAVDTSGLQNASERLAGEGKTVILAAVDGSPAGLIALADTVKPSAASAIRKLRAAGLEAAMITGDNRQTAEAVGKQLGISEVLAEVLPDRKAEAIQKLQSQGGKIAMVGDGINDAPALAQADLGIAMGAGTDVAIETADIVLMRDEPEAVALAIDLSRRTLATIRQNLFWAFGYNVVAIPLAAGIFYPWTGWLLSPIIASAAMAFSSVSVVTNSLRLRRFQPTHDAGGTPMAAPAGTL